MLISGKIEKLSKQAMQDIKPQFEQIDEISMTNTRKVQNAFAKHRVSDTCFNATTGYGYNDKGREILGSVFADIFSAQTALVTSGFVSGTHAIACALFAALRPGQTLLSVTGLPYDTLHGVIGINGKYKGSLKDYGIPYEQVELLKGKSADYDTISSKVKSLDGNIGAVFIQRSRGYSTRNALSVEEIGRICKFIHELNKDIVIVIDNCYGEFTETVEPGDAGADLIAGSLIKNPGGGLVAKGGYVAGKENLVEAAADKLAAPGIGLHCGAAPDGYRLLYQGLYTAPHTVAQALKTAVFSARLFELLGYNTSPGFDDARSDIIQMISLGSEERLEVFCKAIQTAAPVDSFVSPVKSQMPGYDYPVIMAAGTFVQGASIELSADAPVREPYNVFLQGALTFESGRNSVEIAASLL